ncbi:MAG: D-alanyl-D-alanine carboxypeptidase [Clostridia bacterium]|nr:D-alanyl-D-alanine carboxypeptidase [Clostridia bacterium]
MKRIICFVLICVCLFQLGAVNCLAEEQAVMLDLDCPSAILIEASSGQVLYAKDADTPRPMASVTKIMTLLLIMEALEDGKFTLADMVSCSEHAVSMGGSQIYLKEGESLSVEEMLKAIVVSSANDAAVAMAEFVAGSDRSFVSLMNERAKKLGMKNTHFVNCTGLDADDHYSSAADIAVMSAQLLKHDTIRDYTTIWMDTLRDGSFGLSNTNKLVRFYEGCTGLKTGSTSKALYCMSASAKRDGMELISVVLASPTSAKRFEDAKKLLNFGFAGYELYCAKIKVPETVTVLGSKNKSALIECEKEVRLLVEKGVGKNIVIETKLDETVVAPAEKGAKVGEVNFVSGEEILRSFPILLSEVVEKATFLDIFLQIFRVFLTV